MHVQATRSFKIAFVGAALFAVLIVAGVWWICLPDCSRGFDFEADIAKGDVHIIVYGELDPYSTNVSVRLAKQYGFRYDARGCVVTENELECCKLYNEKVIRYLSVRHGDNWYVKYRQRLDSALAVESSLHSR